MIHYTREGEYLRLGLNFRFTPGGFVLLWAWYDFASHSATIYRLRVRMHRKPRFMFAKNKHNVIDTYLHLLAWRLCTAKYCKTSKRSSRPPGGGQQQTRGLSRGI
jgi:hypothetical protein